MGFFKDLFKKENAETKYITIFENSKSEFFINYLYFLANLMYYHNIPN